MYLPLKSVKATNIISGCVELGLIIPVIFTWIFYKPNYAILEISKIEETKSLITLQLLGMLLTKQDLFGEI